MRAAVIGIGSNSVRMLVAEAADGEIRRISRDRAGTRLFAGLDEAGNLSREAMASSCAAVKRMADSARSQGAEKVHLFATSATRDAANNADFAALLKAETGLTLEICSGDEEAALSFFGATDGGDSGVIDIGGGSLEVAMGSDEDPTVALSVPAGAGRVTREFLPESGVADDDDLEAARKNIRKILEPMVKSFPKSKHPMHAVGTSKTIRSLARLAGAVMRQPGRVDTSIMTIDQLEDGLPRLAAIAPDQRTALPGVTPERTYQIVGGGLVIDEIMKALDVKEIEICPWALREGAILRWLDQFGRTRLGF